MMILVASDYGLEQDVNGERLKTVLNSVKNLKGPFENLKILSYSMASVFLH